MYYGCTSVLTATSEHASGGRSSATSLVDQQQAGYLGYIRHPYAVSVYAFASKGADRHNCPLLYGLLIIRLFRVWLSARCCLRLSNGLFMSTAVIIST